MIEAFLALRDIHLPKEIGWWPLAPGWYAVFACLFLLIGLLFYRFSTRKHNRIKKKALQLLKEYEKEYRQKKHSDASIQVAVLLRRVALAYFPRNTVAGLHGEAWLDFLTITSKNLNFHKIKKELLQFPFQSTQAADLNMLFYYTRLWIKQRKRICLS